MKRRWNQKGKECKHDRYRLIYQQDSLAKVENEQKLTIEKLSNNES